MIITQTRQSRSFVGSLNPGADVIGALTQICVDNKIFCAQFSGIGYIADPKLVSYNLTRRGFDPSISHKGTYHVVSLHGNVSLQERQTVIRAHVIGTLHEQGDAGEPRLLTGELVGGEVVSLEFSLTTIDDIRLYRAEDDRTGLDPWLHMDLGGGPPPPVDDRAELPIIQSAPGSAPPSRPAGTSKTVAAPEESDLEVEPGDWLDHPTLGKCKVLSDDHEEHVSIELGSGRKVQLHLGLLQLVPSGHHDDGGRIFKVQIRRRR